MKNKAQILGVALFVTVSLPAGLLPNLVPTVGSSSSLGNLVQNSGFLVGTSTASGSLDQQGFASYSNSTSTNSVTPTSNGTTTGQLLTTGAYSAPATSAATSLNYSYIPSSGAAQLLSETISMSANVTASSSTFRSLLTNATTPTSNAVSTTTAAPFTSGGLLTTQPTGTTGLLSAYSTANTSTQSSSSSLLAAPSSSLLTTTAAPANTPIASAPTATAAPGFTAGGLLIQSVSNTSALINAGVSATVPVLYTSLSTPTISAQALTGTLLTPLPVNNTLNSNLTGVPEPGTWALIASALGALALRRRQLSKR